MSDTLRTPCVAIMSYSEWACSPIFVFENKATMNDLSNIFSVKVDLTTQLVVATDVVVLGLYDSYLSFEYNEYGEVTTMTPSSAPPLIG